MSHDNSLPPKRLAGPTPDRWRGAILRAAAPILLLLVLVACGSSDDDGGPGPSPTPNVVRYTAIGASDAIGFGSSVPCIPFDTVCADGRGYVAIIARQLRGAGRELTLSNLGVPGQVLSSTVQTIGNQYGRGIPGNFLQQQLPFVPRNSTLVTIFAGGNDTNAIGTAVDRGAAGNDPLGYIDAQIRTFATDYASLVRGIRDRAGSPQVIVLNLPNFAGLPFTSGFSATRKRWMQRISVGFSREGANALVGQGVTVVDLLCDSRSYQKSNYSSDGFHPNDAGYTFMAGEVMRAIDGQIGPPQADCSFMRIVQ
jgi:lysophospholipase L1-like esterase